MKRHRTEPTLLETLQPPAGGLQALRRRLARERRRQTRRHYTAGALATAAILGTVLVVALVQPGPGHPGTSLDLQLARMRLGVIEAPPVGVTVPEEIRSTVGAMKVPVANQDVVFYLIASRAPARLAGNPAPNDLSSPP